MRCDPTCGEVRVKSVPVVGPQMDGAVVDTQQIALWNEILPNLGSPQPTRHGGLQVAENERHLQY